jgi:sugar/nucleoside kinase (ribokinase family)
MEPMSFVAGFGIANVDFLFGHMPRVPRPGEEIYSKSFSRQLGGGPVATMIQLARLNVPVRLATYVGSGDQSAFVREQLAQNRVPFVNMHGSREAEPLTVSCIISCPEDRALVSYRPPAEAFRVSEDTVYQFYKGAKVAYVPLEHATLCKRLKQEGAVVVMDSFWDDELCMAWYEDVLPYVDYFTPNEKEALKITGAASVEEALERLSERLPIAMVKLSEKGCAIRKNGATEYIPGVPVPYVDATGAGDAFLAGLLYGIFYGCKPEDSVRLGNITGANAVTRIGCLTAEMNRNQMLSQMEKHYGIRLEGQ